VSSKQGPPLGLEDLLIALGWSHGGSVGDCSVLMVVGSNGPYSHTAVGVGPGSCDAHNNARYHVAPSFYQIDAVYNPPGRRHFAGNETALPAND
jgi:hypothetical protein